MALIDWLRGLPADFAFLLGLPFFVALVGLGGEWWRHHRSREGGTRR
jgi:hypothetical protein